MDIFTLAIYSVHHLHIPTGPIGDRKIMEDVAVIYKRSPREATPSLQSERITSALSFLSIRTPAQPYPDTGESGETYDIEAHLELSSNRNNAQWIRHRPQDVYCDLRTYLCSLSV